MLTKMDRKLRPGPDFSRFNHDRSRPCVGKRRVLPSFSKTPEERLSESRYQSNSAEISTSEATAGENATDPVAAQALIALLHGPAIDQALKHSGFRRVALANGASRGGQMRADKAAGPEVLHVGAARVTQGRGRAVGQTMKERST
jgi:ribosomal protein L12E/L44/L45/RPP1/RPP2